MNIQRIDFVAIPSRDAARSTAFYIDTLGLRSDDHRGLEFWAGEQCLNVWEPKRFGQEFQPQKTAHGEKGCGWLTDRFGVSWQIVPRILMELLSDPDRDKANRVMAAMLQMGKIEIAELQKAADAR